MEPQFKNGTIVALQSHFYTHATDVNKIYIILDVKYKLK